VWHATSQNTEISDGKLQPVLESADLVAIAANQNSRTVTESRRISDTVPVAGRTFVAYFSDKFVTKLATTSASNG
jgi:hypothetical protein